MILCSRGVIDGRGTPRSVSVARTLTKDGRGDVVGCRAAQQRAQPCLELAQVERFDEIVVGANV
jgi:hypothetical protein